MYKRQVSDIGILVGLAIGILAGVLNIVPYFGFLIGFVMSTAMVLLNWSGFGPLIGVVSVFGVVQLLEGYVITPKIVGDKVGLSPVAVIIVLLLGGELFGLLGVLLAIPVAGILRACVPDLINYYKRTPFYSGNYQPPNRESVGLVETLSELADVVENLDDESCDPLLEEGSDDQDGATSVHESDESE